MTDLSETVERVEREITPGSFARVSIAPEDAQSLLSAARRVMAMEAVGGHPEAHAALDAWNCDIAGTPWCRIKAIHLRALIDSAADGAAARAEVERLRGASVVRDALMSGLRDFVSESSLAKLETTWMAGRAEALLREYRELRDALTRAGLGSKPENAR